MDDKNINQEPKIKKRQNKQVEELEQKIRVLEDQLKRAVADYINLEKRTEEEKRDTIKYGNKELLLRLLSGLESLFLAEKYIEDNGLKVTIKHLRDVLKEAGVEQIETAGREFDPNFMECIETIEGKENIVIEETRPGFRLYGKLLKPAQVKVGKTTV
ncbi:MAG: nucleotide exchange factor GrpE [Candidatus Levybacteria bacterium RIFCSPHIGHO2_02_FULL_39_36]|nr:MAG: Protein GrpE [Candidatus Levybacteria bacterium GW2011_GWB1_39_7]KKR27478.1 MAG: Protein GrpE [Microgenomates group bacterium GW2011_GWC1_39_7]KKR48497.1 MAG: Protein GrpE [Candidatus Levybacteria bacterium GW2011_GWA2_40_16]OGH25827.1 MAG: nucleotide exchange factor GrpE [Candidatus Levybacteria bacterium RIFCSPHIGHO2_12_FULL_39_39]OGH28538.1 MAG: nucleotide exchange factor GrpE [Candidatus Levybacteria bacterium RIFCSPHIGHO2_02_FULL_39_36]OGH45653.1 MAG: nucleotide exchange factor Gr